MPHRLHQSDLTRLHLGDTVEWLAGLMTNFATVKTTIFLMEDLSNIASSRGMIVREQMQGIIIVGNGMGNLTASGDPKFEL